MKRCVKDAKDLDVINATNFKHYNILICTNVIAHTP